MTARLRGLVFSRDRALQLDATLRSYLLHVNDSAAAELTVLYTTSSDRHARQYTELIDAFAQTPHVSFVAEREFRRDVLQTIAANVGHSRVGQAMLDRTTVLGPGNLAKRLTRRLLAGARDRHVLFLVDDCIFVRPFDLTQTVDLLARRPTALGFSLRLGRNVTYCYALDRPQALPAFHPAADGVVEFDWTIGEYDFDYPLELSSSVYRVRDILPLLARLEFRNPNQMEARLAENTRRFARKRATLFCYERSVAFCYPINRVQDEFDNRAGDCDAHTADALANVYASGRRIDVAAYRDLVPTACHQLVDLALRPASAEQ